MKPGGWQALAGPLFAALVTMAVIERSDDGPDGWFFRTALIVPL